jgi:hypothetical protein
MQLVDFEGPPIPFSSNVGLNIGIRESAEVIGYASQAIHNMNEMRRNAMNMCIALAKCREAFARYPAESDGAGAGWEEFATKNFIPQGLTLRNVRSAVSAGKMLIDKQQSHPDIFKTFANLSRAALFALSDNQEVFEQTEILIKSSDENRVTAAEIRELRAAIQINEANLSSTRNELLLTLKKAEASKASNSALNERLLDSEREIESLKDQNDELARRAKTPVESLVPTLPASVKSEAEFKAKLEDEIRNGQKTLDGVRTQTEKASEKLTAVQRKLQEQEQLSDVISSLRTDIANLLQKYSLALVKRITDSSPMTKSSLVEVSLGLHALADQISPTI